MKEEWLLAGAAVPVTCETVTALVAEIKQLIDVVGGMALAQPEQPAQRTWVGLTDGAMPILEHIIDGRECWCNPEINYVDPITGVAVIVHKEPN